MVSKPTGRRRGRPRKERPPRRDKAGRPPLQFSDDPDRYAVAYLDALFARKAGSEPACSMAVAAWLVGIEGDPPRPSAERPGLIVGNWEKRPTRSGARAGTLAGKAATLRLKQRRCRSTSEGVWRMAMASAFGLATGARDMESAKAAIIQRATLIGEYRFAKRVLLPMVDAKFASKSLPEFLANLAST